MGKNADQKLEEFIRANPRLAMTLLVGGAGTLASAGVGGLFDSPISAALMAAPAMGLAGYNTGTLLEDRNNLQATVKKYKDAENPKAAGSGMSLSSPTIRTGAGAVAGGLGGAAVGGRRRGMAGILGALLGGVAGNLTAPDGQVKEGSAFPRPASRQQAIRKVASLMQQVHRMQKTAAGEEGAAPAAGAAQGQGFDIVGFLSSPIGRAIVGLVLGGGIGSSIGGGAGAGLGAMGGAALGYGVDWGALLQRLLQPQEPQNQQQQQQTPAAAPAGGSGAAPAGQPSSAAYWAGKGAITGGGAYGGVKALDAFDRARGAISNWRTPAPVPVPAPNGAWRRSVDPIQTANSFSKSIKERPDWGWRNTMKKAPRPTSLTTEVPTAAAAPRAGRGYRAKGLAAVGGSILANLLLGGGGGESAPTGPSAVPQNATY